MIPDPVILEHVVRVGDRLTESFRLTLQEADAMIALGLSFKIYDKRESVFTLEPPYLRRSDSANGT